MKLIKTQTELKESYNRLYLKGRGQLCIRAFDAFYDWVLDILGPARDARLLDMSCGQGFFLKSAAARLECCCGGDISERAVSQARSLVPESRIVATNSELLPFRDKSFDLITSLGSIEHYLNPEEALKEFARCLVPGGKVFIFVPNGYYLGHFWSVYHKGEGPSHDQDFERFEALDFWQELISREFHIEKIYKYNPGTGLAFSSALKHSWKLTCKGDFLGGFRFSAVNLVSRMIPLNISKYFGFLCRLPGGKQEQSS